MANRILAKSILCHSHQIILCQCYNFIGRALNHGPLASFSCFPPFRRPRSSEHLPVERSLGHKPNRLSVHEAKTPSILCFISFRFFQAVHNIKYVYDDLNYRRRNTAVEARWRTQDCGAPTHLRLLGDARGRFKCHRFQWWPSADIQTVFMTQSEYQLCVCVCMCVSFLLFMIRPSVVDLNWEMGAASLYWAAIRANECVYYNILLS